MENDDGVSDFPGYRIRMGCDGIITEKYICGIVACNDPTKLKKVTTQSIVTRKSSKTHASELTTPSFFPFLPVTADLWASLTLKNSAAS